MKPDTVTPTDLVGIGFAEEIAVALEQRFLATHAETGAGSPRDLTLVYAAGQGDGKSRGPGPMSRRRAEKEKRTSRPGQEKQSVLAMPEWAKVRRSLTMEGLFQPMHLFFILLIVLVIFGPGKLPDLGRGLGKGIREFKDALRGGVEGDSGKKA